MIALSVGFYADRIGRRTSVNEYGYSESAAIIVVVEIIESVACRIFCFTNTISLVDTGILCTNGMRSIAKIFLESGIIICHTMRRIVRTKSRNSKARALFESSPLGFYTIRTEERTGVIARVLIENCFIIAITSNSYASTVKKDSYLYLFLWQKNVPAKRDLLHLRIP